MKRLIFHKGNCGKKIPGPRLDLEFYNFQNLSNWPSSLAHSLKRYFDEVIYVISVPDPKNTRSPVVEHGISYEVVSEKDLRNKMNDCDVFFNRAAAITPPEKSIAIYYASSSAIRPKRPSNNWNAILTTGSLQNGRCSKVSNNLYSWVKGDNSNFWMPEEELIEKEFDFVVVGRRGKDIRCVIELAKKYPKMKIAAVGWNGEYNIEKRTFDLPIKSVFNLPNVIELGRMLGHIKIRDVLRRSKIGITITAHGQEGFPMQTQMEYSMTGLHFVYDKSMLRDGYYVNGVTGSPVSKSDYVLENWRTLGQKSRECAIKSFSADVSADCLMKIIGELR